MKSQKITKENLKAIYDVACSGWKTKIEQYAIKNPFSNEVELTNTEIEEMFNASDDKQKKVLLKFFVREKSSIEIINDFQDAYNSLGESDEEVKLYNSMKSMNLPKSMMAYQRLVIFTKALNDGWSSNFKNRSQYKYWNYFYVSTEGVFSPIHVDYDTYNMRVPSALYFKTEELARHCVKIALNDYKDYYNPGL